MDEVTVEPYTVAPEAAPDLATQVEKFAGSGLNGTLKDIRWDPRGAAMNATFVHDSVELKIVSSQHALSVEPIHMKPIEPAHAEYARQMTPECLIRVSDEVMADTVISCSVYALLGYAWASGKVRSTDSIRFDLPLSTGLYGGALRTRTDIVTDETELAVTLTGDCLEVVAYGGNGTAEEQLSAILAQVGASREDLIASMKACQSVSTSWAR